MSEERNKDMQDLEGQDGIELTDEGLDQLAGGYIYHDVGDIEAHRKESFYLLDANGKVVMRVEDAARAQRWAGNLKLSLQPLTADEFKKIRQG